MCKVMNDNNIHDKIRGSLIGGAVGDALGYPVEFMSAQAIMRMYGERGIRRYNPDRISGGVAVVSDDTQMTLFTACGILNSVRTGEDVLDGIRNAYVEWYYTQTGEISRKASKECWISGLPELNVCRAPGNTCMSALSRISNGYEAMNYSKGCGGVMRIAPIALYGAVGGRMGVEESCRMAADASELTHRHPMGYIPSALAAYIIRCLIQDADPTREKCRMYVEDGLEMVTSMYPKCREHIREFSGLIRKAVELSDSSVNDLEAIERSLGEGWTADEALAVAIYCVLQHFDDFEGAMIAAVNHGGDSDSTGAIAGNILGAAMGYGAIPQFYKEGLELHDVIIHIADDLYAGNGTIYNI